MSFTESEEITFSLLLNTFLHERGTLVTHETIMRLNTQQLIQASEKITFNSPPIVKGKKWLHLQSSLHSKQTAVAKEYFASSMSF